MARNWIKIETVTPDKPEICAIATFLKIDPDAALGKLIRLWSWAEVNQINGNNVGVTRGFIDKVVGQQGFADALAHAGWLSGNDGALVFTKFSKHNGKVARGRAQTASRVSRHRERNRKSNDHIVTDKVESSALSGAISSRSEVEAESVESVINRDNELIKNELNVAEECLSELAASADAETAFETLEHQVHNAIVTSDEGDAEPSIAVNEVVAEQAFADEKETEFGVTEGQSGEELAHEEVEEAAEEGTEGLDKGRKRGGGTGGSRKVIVADPPVQPFLF
jgi:DNA polymerase III delta prime subunit